RAYLFVGIEGQNPVAARFRQCRILLPGKPFPRFHKYLGPKRLGNADGRVSAARVHQHDLVGNIFHALQRAPDVGLFVEGDDANRKSHAPKHSRSARGVVVNLVEFATRRWSRPSGVPNKPGVPSTRAVRVMGWKPGVPSTRAVRVMGWKPGFGLLGQ